MNKRKRESQKSGSSKKKKEVVEDEDEIITEEETVAKKKKLKPNKKKQKKKHENLIGINSIDEKEFKKVSIPDKEFFEDMNQFEDVGDSLSFLQPVEEKLTKSKKWKKLKMENFMESEGIMSVEVLDDGDLDDSLFINKNEYEKKSKNKDEDSDSENDYEEDLNEMLDDGNKREYSEEKLANQEIIFGDDVKIITDKKEKLSKKKKRKTKEKSKNADNEASDSEPFVFDEEKMQAWKSYASIVHGDILENLQKLNFVKPTPVQARVLELLVKEPKKNIVAAAETGSGKTLSFGIPIASALLDIADSKTDENYKSEDPSFKRNSKLKALVLTPTRELAVQVDRHIKAILKNTKIRCEALVGGLSEAKQKRILSFRPEIIVATPGRYWELLSAGNKHLIDVDEFSYLIMDEADRMVSEGHFKELYEIFGTINKLRLKLEKPPNIQKFVISATLTLSDQYREGKSSIPHWKRQQISSDELLEKLLKVLDLQNHQIVDLTPEARVARTLLESQVQCLQDEKDDFLYYFALLYKGRTIVFTNSISAVRHIHAFLKELEIKAYALHGEMEQKQRLKNLDKFQKYETAILVATDVAARGLDIPNVRNVIHYQLPRSPEIYVHRCGRAGRAEKEGFSIAIVSPEDKRGYRDICTATNKEEGIEPFPITHLQIKEIHERVTLAKKIASFVLQYNKKKSKANWLVKNANELGVDLDDHFFPGIRQEAERSNEKQREIEKMKERLQDLLKKKIFVERLTSYSYLTSNMDNLRTIEEADTKDLRNDFLKKKQNKKE